MEKKEYNIKVTIYAFKTITVEASSYEEACEISQEKIDSQIHNYPSKIDFSYEFETSNKTEFEINFDDDYEWELYNDIDYNYRYEHENNWTDDEDNKYY